MRLKPIHKKFPSINQYRHVIRNLIHHYRYDGENEDGTTRYNNNSLPLVNFYGTVKAHGTNSCIGQMEEGDNIFYQSRERILTTHSDNAGFATYWKYDESHLQEWMSAIRESFGFQVQDPIYIYGEWCGGNIQGGVALHGLEKMFIVFAIYVGNNWIMPDDVEFIEIMSFNSCTYIHDISDFGAYKIEINLECPELAQDQIIKLVEQVENECPIGKYFNKSGTGEGIVFYATEFGMKYTFKAKGDKHSSSKVRIISSVDIDSVQKLHELVALIVTENRLNQMMEGLKPTIQGVGEYIKRVFSDCFKEELDTIEGNGFTSKEFCGAAANRVKSFWFAKC